MPPTTSVIHGAGERKYAPRRGSTSAASASPVSKNIDQYLPYIAAAAKRPASAASTRRLLSNERRNMKVVAAQSGISTVLELNFKAWKLKNGTSVSSANPSTRLSPSRKRAERRQAIHSASATLTMARR